MDISLYLIKYMQFRIDSNAHFIELYIADGFKSDNIEIVIKDDADRMEEGEQLSDAYINLSNLSTEFSGQVKHLYHRKHTSIYLDWPLNKRNVHTIGSFHSLLPMLALNAPETRIVFSYLSTNVCLRQHL